MECLPCAEREIGRRDRIDNSWEKTLLVPSAFPGSEVIKLMTIVQVATEILQAGRNHNMSQRTKWGIRIFS